MNLSELARKMLEWELKYRELDILEQTIKSTVLEIGKTQTVGNVRASYFKGRAKYDYETPGAQAPQEVINEFSHSEIEIDWMEVAKEAGYTTEMRENHTKKLYSQNGERFVKRLKLIPWCSRKASPA